MEKRSGKSLVAAVIKGDAYNLGIEDCGTAFLSFGSADFFVTSASGKCHLALYVPQARIFVLSGI